MINETPKASPSATFSVISLLISVIISLIGLMVIIGGRGAGMEALSRLPFLITFCGGGLFLAFCLAIAAVFRGERPLILTALAIAIPPVAVLLAPIFGR